MNHITAEELLDPSIFKPDGTIAIPPNATRDDWERIHTITIICKHAAKKWHKASADYGVEHYGVEFVAQVEVEVEAVQLGLPMEVDGKPALNPADKSRVFVSIEGVNQSFLMWQRKMADEIPNWDKAKLQRALDLLTPVEQQAQELRKRLEVA